MLTYLGIRNFAIIESSDIYFEPGMTTITGETGAGKSVLINALNFVLGAKADKKNTTQARTEVSAVFDLQDMPRAETWLAENDYPEEEGQLLLRRMLTSGGRSRVFINGAVAPLAQVRELAELVLSFYGQHAHYHLTRHAIQLNKLDQYLGQEALVEQVAWRAQQVQQLERRYEQAYAEQQQMETEKTLLQYQYEELEALQLQKDELEALESEHKQLSNADQLLQSYGECAEALYGGDDNLAARLDAIARQLASVEGMEAARAATELVEQARVYCGEAYEELTQALEQIERDPERLNEIEQRISTYFDTARKHQVSPYQLYDHYCSIAERLNEFENISARCDTLAAERDQALAAYHQAAAELSEARQQSAEHFAQAVEARIRTLNIPEGEFTARLSSDSTQVSANGYDSCRFQICFNPGQPFADIASIASGGELSRIGLAIQAVASERISPPVLVFDEVDVGISGATAEIAGQLLRELSQRAQVICVTHQAQVAVQGTHQLHIYKEHHSDRTLSKVCPLEVEQRIYEIARITSGATISEENLQAARQLFYQHHPGKLS